MPRKQRPKTIPQRPSGKTPIRRAGTIRASLINETGRGADDGAIWLSRISKTKRQRDSMRNGALDWMMYYRWFEGEQWVNREMLSGGSLASDNARDTATVNTVGSIALSFMPFLVNGDIKAKLKARKPADVVSAQIQEALLNYEWQERGM